MQYFTPPHIGEKIATYKPSFFAYLNSIFASTGKVIFILIWYLVCPLYFIIGQPHPTNWVNWIIGGSIILIDIFVIYIWLSQKRMAKRVNGRSFSLFLVNEGVEINDGFIPFATIYEDGIGTFKLDGDNLLLSTNSTSNFVKLSGYGMYEKDIKFKIDQKFQFCKEELVKYLNSLIPLH